MILNIVWVEDVETTKKAMWYNIEPEIRNLGIEFNIEWFKNGSNVSKYIAQKNGARGKVGEENEEKVVHLMFVDYNLDEEIEEGQTKGLNGKWVIVDTRKHDNELPILFYSSNNDIELEKLIKDEYKVWFSHRDDFIDELLRLLKKEFLF